MNFFENEYALPIILGNSKEAISMANLLHRETELKIHIFADKLSFIDRLLFRFHRIAYLNDDILLLSLSDFADSLQEYFMPVLIFCDSMGRSFVEKHFERLEQRYVIISSQSAKNFFLKDDTDRYEDQ